MSKLHIDVISRDIERKHRTIRENWTVKNYHPSSYEDAHEYLTKYYQYHYSRWLGVGMTLPADVAYSEVRRILESKGGYVPNLKKALRGRYGGMIELINVIAQEFEKESAEKYIRYVIGTHVNPLDYNLKVELARQYLETYGRRMLPGEELMNPHELAANFDAVIKHHVELVNQYRNIVQ